MRGLTCAHCSGAHSTNCPPVAFHSTERYANIRIEADHGSLKARLRPMRGLERDLRRE